MEIEVKCMNCKYDFKTTCIVNDKDEVIDINPNRCPRCSNNTFTSRIQANPNSWFGVIGSNG